MKFKLALIGFGTVGQGLCEILLNKKAHLKEKYDFDWQIVAVSDKLKGSVYCPSGLDTEKLLTFAKENKSLNEYECENEFYTGWDALKTINDSNADIVCELSYTDIKTGQPATDHCRAALNGGKHVVTSNKGPAALFYKELENLARVNNVKFMIEGTVMSGTPVINLARNELAGNEISAIRGILNGTTNFILTKMEEGMNYEDALKLAQELGYAEADPTADVEGYDALAKVTILANVLMGENLKPSDIPCKGVSQITSEDIQNAKVENKKWKLIGEIKKENGTVKASVSPMMIENTHPLAGVNGAVNAITFTTDLLGDVTVTGAGAGKIETGYSILTDMLEINRIYKE